MKEDAHIYNPAIYEKYNEAVRVANKATKTAIESEEQSCHAMIDLLANAKNRGHNIDALHYTSKKWDDMIVKESASNSGSNLTQAQIQMKPTLLLRQHSSPPPFECCATPKEQAKQAGSKCQ
jgi:hypothetical protein